MSFKTPGVYVREVSLFPPSVAQVETAVPAFTGYTEKAMDTNQNDLTGKPVKIKSLADFESLFGKAWIPEEFNVTVDTSEGNAIESIFPDKRYYLYDALRQFYDNGGGACYIVSVGSFADDISFDDLLEGMEALRKYDEPTLLLAPDAVGLKDSDDLADLPQFAALQQSTLRQCAELQDRFAILDIMQGYLAEDVLHQPLTDFRNGIGINNLSYGAVYYPWLLSSYNFQAGFRQLAFYDVSDPDTAISDLAPFTASDQEEALLEILQETIRQTNAATTNIGSVINRNRLLMEGTGYLTALLSAYRLNLERGIAAKNNTTNYLNVMASMAMSFHEADEETAATSPLRREIDLLKENSDLTDALRQLVEMEKNPSVVSNNLASRPIIINLYGGIDADWFGGTVFDDITPEGTAFPESAAGSLQIITALGESTRTILRAYQTLLNAVLFHEKGAESALFAGVSFFKGVKEEIARYMRTIPPSGAVAGVYARTDASRGVWKAPANVSLNSVIAPAVKIDNPGQESMNVHPTGKSINALRNFTGKGTLVWGARTLAGNDNEWRYVPVRRFFIMVEESTKKASAAFVFEPNDANTWVKVKAMIENFLILQWRAGALQGASPADAFFVNVGLGETMTSQDVLEGRMIVEIGMAVVRPAEFIILRFSHKMLSADS